MRPAVCEPDPRSRWRVRKLWLIASITLLGAVAAIWLGTKIDWPAVQRWLEALNPGLLIAAMALLPLGGFSIVIVYLVAGAKFGPLLGGAVVAGITLVHLVASHGIARTLLRGRIERMVARRGHRFPRLEHDADAAVVAIGALLPGLPYFVRNYLLGLSGARLRVILAVCLPIYVARSYLVIMLGDLTDEWSLHGFFLLATIFVVKVTVCALLLRWLRQRHAVKM